MDERDLDEFFKNFEIKRPILNLKRDDSDVEELENIEKVLGEIEKQLILNELAENKIGVVMPSVDDGDESDTDDDEMMVESEAQEAAEEVLEEILVDAYADAVQDELEKAGLLEDEQGKDSMDELTGDFSKFQSEV